VYSRGLPMFTWAQRKHANGGVTITAWHTHKTVTHRLRVLAVHQLDQAIYKVIYVLHTKQREFVMHAVEHQTVDKPHC
jgi:phage-related protein